MGNDFIVIIHCLTYLSVHCDRRFSSQQLAHNACSNPVIVRKVMSLASSKGYVDVVNGANGGYKIQVDPKDISLGDLFILVGRLVTIHAPSLSKSNRFLSKTEYIRYCTTIAKKV